MESTPILVEHLENFTDDQIEQLVDIAIRAFEGGLSHKALLGGDWSLHAPFLRAVARATALQGEIYVVRDPVTKKILSYGCWFGPGNDLFATEEQKALGFNEVFSSVSEKAQYWCTHTYPETVGEYSANLWTKEEVERRWWCVHLCTDSQHENRGYGTAIINFAFEKAKKKGGLIGLSTSIEVNVRKYVAMGFRERGETHVDAPTGGFHVHILSRE
ncbi:hypothetical protein NEOLEDRAFT_1136387 [Neolentinus lepideus HHB14362 ss-1]|uniref:N-acetyltransferase domain-containing protein n=1 Tax=Neolentinus lepideus HHB14362 ss-1 TaxID=1314782 RepID=A0A165RBW2_9AGAM|nr:hypothetical protein NEOLEDRAFT_1136387 [Neolentinus lepideus HHB14362 ss-1]